MLYRPTSFQLLRGAVAILQRKKRLDRYKGDLLWRAAQGVFYHEDLVPYGEYMDILDGKREYKTTKEKVNDAAMSMIDMFTRKE